MMWSKHNSKLQVSWDATSLSSFQQCPYKYYLTVINGWRKPYNVDIDFGSRYHHYRESYYRRYSESGDKETALRDTVRDLMRETWGWETGDTKKNRRTLLRAICWAAEEFDHPPVTKDSLEVSFGIPLGISSPYEEAYILCGYLDRQSEILGDKGFVEMKSTKNTLSSRKKLDYSPNTQVSIYSCASDIIWGVGRGFVEVCQTAVTFCRFMIIPISRQKSEREETWEEVKWWVKTAERCAEEGYWPRNENACGMFGGCEFREDVCSCPSQQRLGILKAGFKQEWWDPTLTRS